MLLGARMFPRCTVDPNTGSDSIGGSKLRSMLQPLFAHIGFSAGLAVVSNVGQQVCEHSHKRHLWKGYPGTFLVLAALRRPLATTSSPPAQLIASRPPATTSHRNP